jgi:hypothetical protein
MDGKTKLPRREILKKGAMAGAASLGLTKLASASESTPIGHNSAPASESVIGMKFSPVDIVRIGVIGVGARGSSMLHEFLAVDNVQITAVCDIVKDKTVSARSTIEKAGGKAPALYFNGDHDFENLCERDDIDFIYVATPWDWHVSMALAAMNNGKHVGLEVPAAMTVKDCWALVSSSEKNRRHCIMMENCCYGYNEMMVLNLVRAGLLGDLLHAEAAYIHDLRALLFSNESEGLWRRFPHITQDGNLYPTHGLGPVANYLNINRGDRFDYMVSMSSLERGLTRYRQEHVPASDPKWKEKYKCGDMNTSLIKTVNGRTIMLQHAVATPRPYDRINLVSGTKGIFRDYPPRLYLDGQPGGEKWTTLDKYKPQYEPALWARIGELARKRGGHGGMDFIMVYRLIQCLREGLAPDMDVYDAASWTAPGPLSQLSAAEGSSPVKFPDFTRGRWKGAR